jgi:hypothetical protein
VGRTLRTEELSRDVEVLTAHNDNLLSVEQLLGHSTGQTTEKVALAIDGDLSHSHISNPSIIKSYMHPTKDCDSSRNRGVAGRTHDWLEGRHRVLLHWLMRRLCRRIVVSSTFVLVEELSILS